MLPASVRIFVCAAPQDLRRSFDGLAAAAQQLVGDSGSSTAWAKTSPANITPSAEPAPVPAGVGAVTASRNPPTAMSATATQWRPQRLNPSFT